MDPAPPRRSHSAAARLARLLPVAIPLAILLATGFVGLDFGRHWDEWLAMRSLRQAIASEVLLPDFYNYPSVPFWLSLWSLSPEIPGDLPRYQRELADLQAHLDGFVMSPEFRLRVRGVFLVVSSLAVLWTYLACLRWRGRVGEALQVRQAERESTAPRFLARDGRQEVDGGPQPLGRGQPGVGALGAVGRPHQPLPGAGVVGRLEVVGDRVRVGAGAG